MRLITDLHAVLTLEIGGDIPSFLLYAFMACTGTLPLAGKLELSLVAARNVVRAHKHFCAKESK